MGFGGEGKPRGRTCCDDLPGVIWSLNIHSFVCHTIKKRIKKGLAQLYRVSSLIFIVFLINSDSIKL